MHFYIVFNCGTTDLISPDNGQVTGLPLFLDSVVSYTCDSGYTLVGNAMRTCIVGGWNGTNPICGKAIYSDTRYGKLYPTVT